jgi:DNA-binding transcriptional regulator YiaG
MNNNTAAEFRNLRKKSGLSVAALSRMIKTSESSIKR